MNDRFDAYHKWLGIPPEEQPPNHYRLLGIKVFETDRDVIETAADQRMAHLRNYQTGQRSQLSQQLLNQVSSARLVLLQPEKKLVYDQQLLCDAGPTDPGSPAERAVHKAGTLLQEPPRAQTSVKQQPRAAGPLPPKPVPVPPPPSPPRASVDVAGPSLAMRHLYRKEVSILFPFIVTSLLVAAAATVVVMVRENSLPPENSVGNPSIQSRGDPSSVSIREEASPAPAARSETGSGEVVPAEVDSPLAAEEAVGTESAAAGERFAEPTPATTGAAGLAGLNGSDGHNQQEQTQGVGNIVSENPEDAEASLHLGRLYCFEQDDWDRGLPYLARGDDAELAKLAQQDLEGPADLLGQLRLADAWWDLAQTRDDAEKDALMFRAGHWYETSPQEYLSALRAAQIEERLAAIAGIGRGSSPSGIDGQHQEQSQIETSSPVAHVRQLQRQCAESLGVQVEAINSIGMKLVLIPPGEFMMGSSDPEQRHSFVGLPQHRVRITQPFYLGAYEVTQEQYEQIMGKNPAIYKGANWPVERVGWNEAVEFCRRLSEKEDRPYRLPTEAEWEYACRAGTTKRYYWGDSEADLFRHGDYCDACNTRSHSWQDRDHDDGYEMTSPVGSYLPNAWGLYDMSGNVREWCNDWYCDQYNLDLPMTDPAGSNTGSLRVWRGGGWDDGCAACRSSARGGNSPNRQHSAQGFRVAVSLLTEARQSSTDRHPDAGELESTGTRLGDMSESRKKDIESF